MTHSTARLGDIPKRLRDVFQRIEQLGDLQADWDSYGGEPPARLAIRTAHEVFRDVIGAWPALPDQRLRPFAVAPLRDGGVQMEWRTSAKELELEIGADGGIGYLLIDKRGSQREFAEGDTISRTEALDLIGLVLASE